MTAHAALPVQPAPPTLGLIQFNFTKRLDGGAAFRGLTWRCHRHLQANLYDPRGYIASAHAPECVCFGHRRKCRRLLSILTKINRTLELERCQDRRMDAFNKKALLACLLRRPCCRQTDENPTTRPMGY